MINSTALSPSRATSDCIATHFNHFIRCIHHRCLLIYCKPRFYCRHTVTNWCNVKQTTPNSISNSASKSRW